MWRCLLALFTLSALVACGGDENLPASNMVFKSRGSVQCTGGGTPPAAMSLELTNAGIVVLSSACGIDGLAHVAVCGASDGAINIFEIPEGQTSNALSLSFSLLSSLPTASEVPCP
jgi:hypothetical protein